MPSDKRNARCPECDEMFTPQGLNGHLRYQHGREPSEASKGAASTSSAADKSKATIQLVELLNAVRARRAQLPAREDDFWGDAPADCDPVLGECGEALDARELELVNQIRALSGKGPVERVTEAGFLGFGARTTLREVTAGATAGADPIVSELPSRED